MFERCKNVLLFCCAGMTFLLLVGLSSPRNEESWKFIQRCLLQAYNQTSDGELKKWELSVTEDGFFRLKKYFPSGKQEYFSFNITRLKDVSFNGTSEQGDIIFKTREDDIIVQTFNDPKGNIDSMSTQFKLPVLKMGPQQLDSLRSVLLMFKH